VLITRWARRLDESFEKIFAVSVHDLLSKPCPDATRATSREVTPKQHTDTMLRRFTKLPNLSEIGQVPRRARPLILRTVLID
jgi:hypothetical protein